LVQNCPECNKLGATTECQYMEFPAGMHHYFDKKVCTFHYWLLYVNPRKGWEEYLEFARAEGAAAGYVVTLPPDVVMKTTTGRAVQGSPEGTKAPPSAPSGR
jgi:hypothetical protein